MTSQKNFFKKNPKFFVLDGSSLLASHSQEFTIVSPVGNYGYHVTVSDNDFVEYSGTYENLSTTTKNVSPKGNVCYFLSFDDHNQSWVLDKNALIYDVRSGLDTFLSGQPNMADFFSWNLKWQKLPSFWSFLNCYREYCRIFSSNDCEEKEHLKKIWEVEYALDFSTYSTSNYYNASKKSVEIFWQHKDIIRNNHQKYKATIPGNNLDAKLGFYWSIYESLLPVLDELMALDYQ